MTNGDEQSGKLELTSVPEIRRIWHKDEWYFSVVDVIAFLTGTKNAQSYWSVLKNRMKAEGFDEALHVEQLRLPAADKRFRLTDTMNLQAVLRLIQSIPSPRVESLRQWLAQVGEERLEEVEHPELALERVRASYRARGYDEAWIEARIKNDLIRNELTDEWQARGAKEGVEYAILTNELSKGTFGFTVTAHKEYKLLPTRANLRDHMTPIELALTSLSEDTAVTYHRERDSQGFSKLKQDAIDAGRATGRARQALEEEMGRPVVSSENYLHLKKVKGTPPQEQLSEPKQESQGTFFDE